MIPFLFFLFKHCSSSYYYSFTLHPKCFTYILAASFPYHIISVMSSLLLPHLSISCLPSILYFYFYFFISSGLLSYLRNGVFGEWRNSNLLFFSFFSFLFCSQVSFIPLYRYIHILQLAFLLELNFPFDILDVKRGGNWGGERIERIIHLIIDSTALPVPTSTGTVIY